jgi:hypothetical protein
LSCGGDLRGDQSGILGPDPIGDQDQLLGTVAAQNVRRTRLISATAITRVIMPLCSAPSMLFAGASTARSARPSGIDRACAQRDNCN